MTKVSDEADTLIGMLMAECRMLFENPGLCEWAGKQGDFAGQHKALAGKTAHASVKEAVSDLLKLLP